MPQPQSRLSHVPQAGRIDPRWLHRAAAKHGAKHSGARRLNGTKNSATQLKARAAAVAAGALPPSGLVDTAGSSSCSAEFGQCGGSTWMGPRCCAPPHRCYKQSEWYSQCGSGCPDDAGWACHHGLRSIGIVVVRYGGWPAWTPLLLHTLRANPTIDFHLLSDVPPPALGGATAPNVRHHAWGVEQLLTRLRERVGVRLRRLSAEGVFGSGVSAAKLNDFKPMLGASLALDLGAICLPGVLPSVAQDLPVISPYLPRRGAA